MQRKIKFRAWDKQNKSMEEVELLGDAVLRIKHAEWEDREDFEVMQYTGLKDKNGKEIYEGDILNYDNGIGVMGTVIWYGDGFAMKVLGAGMASNKTLYNSLEDIEVIGNIHENLELLKEGE